MPKLSILLPFRNAAATLPACLASITNQSFKEFELLAVNDNSTDNARALIQRASSTDGRIRLLDNPGSGLVSALNFGLSQATTPLIARMDADDLMHPRRLERQYRHLTQNPQLTLLASAVRLFPEEQIMAGYREYIRWQNRCLTPEQIANQIYIESPFAHPSVVFRKAAVMELGGYREGPFPEDYDLWLRLHHRGHQMAKLPDILLAWREYPTRTSRTDARCSRAAFDQLRADYLARDPRLLKHRDNFVIWGAGRKTRKRCRLLLEKGFHPRAWIDIDPKKIGNRVQGAPVHPPRWLASETQRPFVLVYVTNHGARDLIAEDLTTLGYAQGDGYLMVG